MKKTNKLLSIILAILMIVTTVPMAFAADIVAGGNCGAEGDNLTWMLDSDGLLTISGEGAMEDYNTESPWYSCLDKIKSVVISDGVTSIGGDAFSGCKNLKSVTIPEGVTSIGEFAFDHCGILEDTTIPDSVTSIGKGAFEYCTSFKKITIPEGVTSIDEAAFICCRQLKEITIPNSVVSIGINAFYATALEKVNVPCTWDGSLYTFEDNVVVNKAHNIVIDEYKAPTCTEAGNEAGQHCTFCETVTVIPALNHDIIIDSAYVAPTCTKTGFTEASHCSRCDNMTITQEVIPALNHKDTLVQVDAKVPTCTEIGWDAYEYCTVCTYSTYAEEAALDHDIIIDEYKAPTCTQTGLAEGSHCGRCSEIFVAQQEIEKLPHVDEDADNYCDGCGAEMLCSDCGRPVHEGEINEYICLLITFVKLIVDLVRSLGA